MKIETETDLDQTERNEETIESNMEAKTEINQTADILEQAVTAIKIDPNESTTNDSEIKIDSNEDVTNDSEIKSDPNEMITNDSEIRIDPKEVQVNENEEKLKSLKEVKSDVTVPYGLQCRICQTKLMYPNSALVDCRGKYFFERARPQPGYSFTKFSI